MAGTIYYLSPDLDAPSGGVRVLYRHVDILNAAGRDAMILHRTPGFACKWFRHKTPTACLDQTQFTPDDTVVVPEVYGSDAIDRLKGVRKVVFNQSGFLTFDGTEMGTFEHANIHRNRDVIGVLAVSEHVMDYVSFVFPGARTIRVRPSVDPQLFRYTRRKLPQIAFMPRRNSVDIHQVLNMLMVRGALQGLELVAIHGLAPDAVARVMCDSAFFFAFSPQEGFGLPSAEAMLCGCTVVGYHGFGGREFMRPEFSYPVEPCDTVSFARKAEEAIMLWRDSPRKSERMGHAAAEFIAANYSPDGERASVLQAWDELLA